MKKIVLIFVVLITLFGIIDLVTVTSILLGGGSLHPQLREHFVTAPLLVLFSWLLYSKYFPSK